MALLLTAKDPSALLHVKVTTVTILLHYGHFLIELQAPKGELAPGHWGGVDRRWVSIDQWVAEGAAAGVGLGVARLRAAAGGAVHHLDGAQVVVSTQPVPVQPLASVGPGLAGHGEPVGGHAALDGGYALGPGQVRLRLVGGSGADLTKDHRVCVGAVPHAVLQLLQVRRTVADGRIAAVMQAVWA